MTITAVAAEVRAQRHFQGTVRRRVTSIVMIVIILAFAAVLVMPGLIAHTSPLDNGMDLLAAPSAHHPFGTDQLGRDIYARVIFGARPVLTASLLGVLLASLAGVTVGTIGGIAPRWISTVVMRIVDMLLALPVLLIALILIATIGTGLWSIVIALGVAYTPGFARIVEASIRKLRAIEFVQAARIFGSGGVQITIRHLLPNLITEVIVMASSAIGWATLTATTLSFLGLGVQLPNPDWGSDLAAGATSLSTNWWLPTFPGLAITVTILVANYAGDWMMDLLDPRRTRSHARFRFLRGIGHTMPAATNASAASEGVPGMAGPAREAAPQTSSSTASERQS
ncbi:peptide ABC transporter permease [Microlunatus endophyticus]|uniref:Peptide ABC transporter permease n=1 Tax=Microlunatus endophyticus TaxID=1716077 RepID=A0A917S4F8_9ACTN|nr:ABC transporter permease [Microlunatus endophyticus]GGL57150.1 peptide ABC transporter permease [Microlunatus endophyticus]